METSVKLLGRPEILHGGKTLPLSPGKTNALLAYLAYADGWVPRDDLVLLLWPDYDGSRARSNLRQLLTGIRRLEVAGNVEIERTRLRWDVETDARTFLQALEDGDAEAALKAHGGGLLAGFHLEGAPEFDSWLDVERTTIHQRWREACLDHADVLRRHGRHAEAVRICERLVAADPLDEHAWRMVCATLAEGGRRAEAIDRFEAFSRSLSEELGMKPDAASLELLREIRDTPRDRPIREAALGERTTSWAAITQHGSKTFVGRRDELGRLKASLLDERRRLVTLLGHGGMGKTRLALELSKHIRGHYRDGVHVVFLTDTEDGGIAAAVSASLGISRTDHSEPAHAIFSRLQDVEALLILDNLEHLSEASSFVRELLARTERLQILATSRARLNLTIEHLIEVYGLTHPVDAVSAPEAHELEAFESVQLFSQKARQLDRSFEPADHPRAVASICVHTGGMPLALEFAAAWLRVMPIDEVAATLERDPNLLEATEIDVEERHGTIERVFAASWELLSEREREWLNRLTVFVGSFSREAAQEVTGVGLPQLLALRNKSFLELRDSGRFHWHPMVERFARAKAREQSELIEDMRERHATYFFERKDAYEVVIRGGSQRFADAVEDVILEQANILDAVRWAADRGRADLLARLVGTVVVDGAWAAGRADELEAAFRQALESVPRDTKEWTALVSGLFGLHLRMDFQHARPAELRVLVEASLQICRRRGDQPGIAWNLLHLGILDAVCERFDEARAWWTEARTLFEHQGNDIRAATSTENLMLLEVQPRERERLFEEVLDRYRAGGYEFELPELLHGHAKFLAYAYGDWSKARSLVDHALSLRGKANPFHRAACLLDDAVLATCQGSFLDADTRIRACLEEIATFTNAAAMRMRTEIAVQSARAHLARGDVDAARVAAAGLDDTALQIRLALAQGERERARRLLDVEGFGVPTARPPRNMIQAQIERDLLTAEVWIAHGDIEASRRHLGDAVRSACAHTFVPHSLEAMRLAAETTQGDRSATLRSIAATHPAAMFETRRLAGEHVRGAADEDLGTGLTTEQVLQTAATLIEA